MISILAILDRGFLSAVNDKWKEMLGLILLLQIGVSIAMYAINYLTFGNMATSGVEAGHRLLKQDLEVYTKDLPETIKPFKHIVLHLHLRVESLILKDQNWIFSSFNIPIFRLV